MNSSLDGNPFSSRFIQPGAIDYLCTEESLDTLGQRLLSQPRCQLTGPHGSGKSTLMHSLARWWTQRAGPVTLLRISAHRRVGQRRQWPAQDDSLLRPLWCIDGWDGCSMLQRWRLAWSWQWRRPHLLLTNHQRRFGWHPLADCQPHLETVLAVVQQLQQHLPPAHRIGSERAAAAFQRQDGNIRETLFELYDVFEDQRVKTTVG